MYISRNARSRRVSLERRDLRKRERRKENDARETTIRRKKEEEERKIESFFRSGRLRESERTRERERGNKTFLFFSNDLQRCASRGVLSLSLSLSSRSFVFVTLLQAYTTHKHAPKRKQNAFFCFFREGGEVIEKKKSKKKKKNKTKTKRKRESSRKLRRRRRRLRLLLRACCWERSARLSTRRRL